MEIMRKSSYRTIFSGILATAFLAAGLAGCVKSGVNSTSNTKAATYIGVMNLAPYSPSTEVYLNDVKQTNAIAAGNYSTAYAPLTPGTYGIKFKKGGSDSLMAELPASNYDSASFYSLIMYNDTIKGITKAIQVYDDFQNITITSGFYRFFNFSPETPSVDVYLNNAKVMTGRNHADIVTNPAYRNFQQLDPLSYTIQVKKSGTDSVIATLSNVPIAAGNAYTVFLNGSSANAADQINLTILRATY